MLKPQQFADFVWSGCQGYVVKVKTLWFELQRAVLELNLLELGLGHKVWLGVEVKLLCYDIFTWQKVSKLETTAFVEFLEIFRH